ncbi:MAG: hypothetical protein IPI79_12610 [Moraxellaceae bacterium]|nr:hypothetical protein [Moraxellaceae bacterium]
MWGEIVAGKRSVTANAALRLSRFWHLYAVLLVWQAHYDLGFAKESLGDTLAHIDHLCL